MNTSLNILIVEDEILSAHKLRDMLKKQLPHARILKITDSVAETLEYLQTKPQIDLGFFDIQLADGVSFEIFENTHVPFPVIFTTAFNEYAIRAFKVNSIDYLLKPIGEQALQFALEQFQQSRLSASGSLSENQLSQTLNMLTKKHKTRFLVKVGEHLRTIPTENISLFYSMDKAVYLKTAEDRNYSIDFTLDQLSELLNPEKFYRVSRKHIVSLDAIADIISYSGSRLRIKLRLSADEDILVSRERVNAFKEWLSH